jgi:hypothetical protein
MRELLDSTYKDSLNRDVTIKGDGLLCANDGNQNDPFVARAFGGTSLLRFSGDFFCQQGFIDFDEQPLLSFWPAAMLQQSDRKKALNTILGASSLLEKCTAELDPKREPGVPRTLIGGTMLENDTAQVRRSRFPEGFFTSSAECLDVARFYSVLHILRKSSTSKDRALYLRLLQQWIETHGFLARQGTEERRLDVVLASATDATTGSLSAARATYDQVMDRLERGWIMVLAESTRNGGALLFDTDNEVWANPDYRSHWKRGTFSVPGISEAPHHEQPYGIAPLLLEVLTSYLDLVRSHLEQTDVETYSASLGGSLDHGYRVDAQGPYRLGWRQFPA